MTMKNIIGGSLLASTLVAAGCGGEWHLRRGAEALQRKDLETAASDLERAVRRMPQNAEARNLYAVALMEQGRHETAEAQLRAALRISPNDPGARYNLAVTLFERGQFSEAAEFLKTLVDEGPPQMPMGDALTLLGDCQERLGNTAAAVATFSKLAAQSHLWTGRAELCNQLGIFYARRERTRDAENWFKYALRADPHYAPAHQNLARLYHFYLPNKAAARPHYVRFIELTDSPAQREQAQGLLAALEKELRPTLAVPTIKPEPVVLAPPPIWGPAPAPKPETTAAQAKASQSVPDRKRAELLFAAAHEEQTRGEWGKALAGYEQAAAADPTFAEPHYNTGYVHQTRGQPADAIAAYQKALAINPQMAKAHLNLALVYYAQNRKSEALQHFEETVRLDPGNVQAHQYLGHLYAAMPGRRIDAKRHYQRFLELRPNDPQAAAIREWLARAAP